MLPSHQTKSTNPNKIMKDNSNKIYQYEHQQIQNQ